MKSSKVLTVLFAAMVLVHCQCSAFNALVAFGDSYTDTGNLPSSPPDYWNGRFSNGPLWLEYLSQSLGFAYYAPNNYAVTGSESDQLGTQISYFPGTSDSANVLFAIWSGNNDFGNHLNLGYNDSAWNDRINNLLSSLTTSIDLLYQQGARNIILFNQFDLTQTPQVRNSYSSSFRDYIRGKLLTFNSRLSNALPNVLNSHPGLQIFSIDIYSDVNYVLANYSSYGFTRTTIGALDDPNLNDKSFTGPGADYLFWDSEHPTTKAHSLISSWVFAALPEQTPPPTVTLSSPANNSQFTAPANIPLEADVTANGWSINQVTFFHEGTFIGQSSTPPYSITWSSVPAGSYSLNAQVSYGANQTVSSGSVSVTVAAAAPSPLPAPWNHQDIGNVALDGTASYDGPGTFTVSGSGDDIWDTSDSFQFAYRLSSGDGAVLARVTAQGNTSDFAKAGLMFRETLDPTSRNIMQFVSPSNGVGFQSRDSTGGASSYAAGPPQAVPVWLKLERIGNTFNGYSSLDGNTWTLSDSKTFAMAGQLYAGLAVTAHNNSALSSASFASVQMAFSVSPPGLKIARLSDGTVQLTLTSQPGTTLRSEASSDLRSWLPISTNLNNSGTVQILDSQAPGLPRRFYRVFALP